ncbi:MAG: hypothetical protein PWQ87_318 [Candidatus Woesearchaeota archaeon]|nr:hypothetical protein [Candidatus Woesearchaeota archaeon]
MNKRRIDKRRYIVSFVITLAIFSLGYFLGFVMENIRIDYFEEAYEKQELGFKSLQLQYQLAESNILKENCKGLKELFNTFVQDLEQQRSRLEAYSRETNINEEEFKVMKRKYTLSQINFWYIANLLKERCPEEGDFVTILYFYGDEKDCPRCEEQGIILDYFKLKLGNKLFTFALDSNFEEEPTIQLLMSTYNVSSLPGLVVDSKTYGFLTKEELGEILCSKIEDEEAMSKIC